MAKDKKNKWLEYICAVMTVLLIVGGLNWGLVGLFDFNLVDAILGLVSMQEYAYLVYILVGISAVVEIGCLISKKK